MRAILTGLWLTIAALAGQAVAQGWQEPGRGTATRADLMDAIRPHAEWVLGTPIEFVVYDLREYGNLAFANLAPQRPGGGAIDPFATPGYVRGDFAPEELDGVAIQVLYFKSGRTWVALHWAIGATDVWYAHDQICAVWRPVIPEACEGI